MTDSWYRKLAGRFIVFDGPDGSGKSSQFRRFSNLAQENGITVCEVREPGGTIIGEHIRQVLLDPDHDMMDIYTEMLLYMASRAQLVHERIQPAIEEGQLVLADRFVSSTLAYQGHAGGIDPVDIHAAATIACRSMTPDLIVVFDVDEKTAAGRLNPLLDRMEAKGAAFHKLVRQGYLKQAKDDPDHYLVIDATVAEETVFNSLTDHMQHHFNT